MKHLNINFEIKVYEENKKKYVFLSHDRARGVTYEIRGAADLNRTVGTYVSKVYLEAISPDNLAETLNNE